jgi:DNA polymerase-1
MTQAQGFYPLALFKNKVGRKRNWLVEGDYAQLELRLITLLSGDKPLLDTFEAKEDPHRANAADVFGIDPEEVGKPERDFAKIFVYATIYLATAETVWKSCVVDFPDVTLSSITRSMDRFYAKHPKIREWQHKTVAVAKQNDYVEAPITGHRIYFYRLVDPQKAVNYPVQHTAADIINPATRRVFNALKWGPEGIMLQCHDALICDGPDPWRLVQILTKNMTTRLTLHGNSMLFPIDTKIGPDWGHLKEVKTEADVKKAMREARSIYRALPK